MDNTRTQGGDNSHTNRMRPNPLPVSMGPYAVLLWTCVLAGFVLLDPVINKRSTLRDGVFGTGILCIVVIIQLFGLLAVLMRKANLMKIYAYLFVLTAVYVLTYRLTRILTLKAEKEAILARCVIDRAINNSFHETVRMQGLAVELCHLSWTADIGFNLSIFILEFFAAALVHYTLLCRNSWTHPVSQIPLGNRTHLKPAQRMEEYLRRSHTKWYLKT